MTNFKLRGVKLRDYKSEKTGKTIQVLETQIVEQPSFCKQCGKEPRQRASSRCVQCAEQYKLQQVNDNRLQKKITNQLKNNI
jgi:predicted Zn-ribbon and HTH transcriptional regulator